MKFNILELKPIKENFPKVWFDLYDREYKLPFLYHYYYKSHSAVRKYLQFYKRPEKAVELLKIKNSSEKSILDIGCDWGYLLMLIKTRYPKINCFGIDLDSYSCEFGNRLAKHNNIDIKLRYGNARKLPFDENSFDYVVSTGTFEHILPEWRDEAMKEIYRVLKNDGRFVILFPNASGFVQKVKDFISEKTPLARHTKWLPNLQGRKTKFIKLPHSLNKKDVISATDSETSDQFTNRLMKHNFLIEDKGAFIFMVEVIPNWLMRPSVFLEHWLEKNSLINRYCTTSYFSALKRPK